MSAKIITVFNQKGGCGKTMMTMQLGGAMALSGLKTLVIDMDPQNTSHIWSLQSDAEAPFPADVVSMAPLKEAFIEKLPQIVSKYDVIVIDCPPALGSRVPWAALGVADLALIPVIPVLDNVWASKQAEQLVLEAMEHRKQRGDDGLQAAFLLNMVRRGNVFESCLSALEDQSTLPILKNSVSMLNAFPECQVYGCAVKSFGASKATKQIDLLVQEACKEIGINVKVKK